MTVDAPSGLSGTAEWLITLLRPHTPFAEAIVKRQVERAGLRIEALGSADLATVGPMIAKAAATFLDPSALAEIKRQLVR